MKHFLIILTALLIISCSKEDEITKSKGTKLVSIAHFNQHDNWEENFFYDSNNRLYKIEDHRAGGRRFEMEYADGKLLQITVYRMIDNQKTSRDSIVYNSNGDIDKRYYFSINFGENLPLARIHEYEYDDSGKLAKKSIYDKKAERYTEVARYYWNGDNIERIDRGPFLWGFCYTFDDKVNYARNLPTSIYSPEKWSKNNVIIRTIKDDVGNLDSECNPCESTYTYNADNLPVRIETYLDRMELRYEILPSDIEK